jgi:predicted DNA-binding antitoxin AbrB/MazE fold protein
LENRYVYAVQCSGKASRQHTKAIHHIAITIIFDIPNSLIYIQYKLQFQKEGVDMVTKTIKERVSKGIIEPLEKLDIDEGKELRITIEEIDKTTDDDAFKRAAGAWKDTVDCEELIKNIYNDRLISTRQ